MKTNRPATEGSSPPQTSILSRKPFLTFMLVLLAVLVWLFRMEFHPDYVVFSNDGPLGLNSADYNRAPMPDPLPWLVDMIEALAREP